MSTSLTLVGRCGPIAEHLTLALQERGYSIVRSFDLQSARAMIPNGCSCPHHHTTQCTCQYMVLMVYPAQTGSPRAIILHEFEGITRVKLDDPEGTLATLILKKELETGNEDEKEDKPDEMENWAVLRNSLDGIRNDEH
jgi:hypothetical protein